MLLETIIGLIISGLIAPITARVILEFINKPKLIVEPMEKPGEEPPEIQQVKGKHRVFYHVKVKNEGRAPAKNLRAELVFYKEGKRVCGFYARWVFNPAPLRYELTQWKGLITVLEPSLAPQGELIDIPPGGGENFCTLIKYEGEDECHGFSSYSYLSPDQKKQELKLYPGKYSVRLNLAGENVHKEEWLKIECKRWGDVEREGNIEEIFSHAVVTNV